jgi:hypothetical protein
MNYTQNFIHECEELYNKIKQNRTIKECLNTAAAATATSDSVIDIYEPLWFVYYMFFAIHNPKMEDYIKKKSAAAAEGMGRNPQDIIKNLLNRRNYTSTIVFELYTHAYTNKGAVTHIYPKYKNNILIKSFKENHLKTTAVILRRECGATGADDTAAAIEPTTAALTEFLEYIITTQPTIIRPHATTTTTRAADTVVHRINNDINYKRKDIILLALVCYMKVDEDDINKKNIFITATDEEVKEAVAPT